MQAPDIFPATRAHALDRLAAFVPAMGARYAAERNADRGAPHRNVSTLSPFLRHRLLTEAEVAAAAADAHGPKEAEKFIAEVFWRTYFKGWLETHPSVWLRYRDRVAALAEDLDRAPYARTYRRAVQGETGIACFDHWAEELTGTGYLHNHARMWFASIWIFTLNLPWALGADFFLRHLLDGDAASNTLSWRWVAGLHTAGKAYAARADNIAKYTDGRFDPAGQLAEEVTALDDDWNGEAGDAPDAGVFVPGGEPGLLLLHEDDLGWESLPLGQTDIRGVAVLTAAAHRSPLPVAERVEAFTAEAAEGAAAAAATHYGAPVMPASSANGIVSAAREAGATRLIVPYVPTGPQHDRFGAIRQAAGEAGMAIDLVQRAHDRAAWPHCTRGFFKLKKKIPSLMGA